MMLRFGVSNFGSIQNYVEISLLASEPPDASGPALLKVGSQQLLPFVLIFGPKDAGKSSLVEAMRTMSEHIRAWARNESASDTKAAEWFERPAPRLDQPTRFDCDIYRRKIRYHYGFEFDTGGYLREWLDRIYGTERETLFLRTGDSIEFADELAAEEQQLRPLLKPDCLVLSLARRTDGLLRGLRLEIPDYTVGEKDDSKEAQRYIASKADKRLNPYLRSFGTDITGFEIDWGKASRLKRFILMSAQHLDLNEKARKAGKKETDWGTRVAVWRSRRPIAVLHKAGQKRFRIPFTDEAPQLQRFMQILTSAFSEIEIGQRLSVDELDASIGTSLALQVLDLFSDWRVNWRKAQLIATTSSPDLIESRQVRRDQVRIIQRKPDGTTAIYSLSELDESNAVDADGNLQGLYGPIPYTGDIRNLFDREVRWQWPAIHEKIIGRTPEGKQYWTFRKRMKMASCFIDCSLGDPALSPDQQRAKLAGLTKAFRSILARRRWRWSLRP